MHQVISSAPAPGFMGGFASLAYRHRFVHARGLILIPALISLSFAARNVSQQFRRQARLLGTAQQVRSRVAQPLPSCNLVSSVATAFQEVSLAGGVLCAPNRGVVSHTGFQTLPLDSLARSTINWCEPDYVQSYYVAEFWNSVSRIVQRVNARTVAP